MRPRLPPPAALRPAPLRAARRRPQGKDWNGQLKWGTSPFYGANYFQSVTPSLSLGGEVFYLQNHQRRWGAPGTVQCRPQRRVQQGSR